MAKSKGISVDIIDHGVLGAFDAMLDMALPNARQAVLDGALVVESHTKGMAQTLIYATPETLHYKRTREYMKRIQATGKVEVKRSEVSAACAIAVKYAAPVEFGTENADGSTRMPARPVMGMGLEAAKKDVEDVYKAHFGGS